MRVVKLVSLSIVLQKWREGQRGGGGDKEEREGQRGGGDKEEREGQRGGDDKEEREGGEKVDKKERDKTKEQKWSEVF